MSTLLLAALCSGLLLGCSKHLAYEGDLEVAYPVAGEVASHQLLRMRVTDVEGKLSVERRNQLGGEIAKQVAMQTHFDRVVPYAKSAYAAETAPVLELDVRRREVSVDEVRREKGLFTEGRLYSADERLLGRFEVEASSDVDTLYIAGLPMSGRGRKGAFGRISYRTGSYIADFLNGYDDER